MPPLPREERALPAALFLVALTTLMFEVLLTRVFSLTLWYHFACMAISLAMLGMTLGALLVFLRPQAWPQATLARSMGRCAELFALSMTAVILLHSVMFVPNPTGYPVPMMLTFAAAALAGARYDATRMSDQRRAAIMPTPKPSYRSVAIRRQEKSRLAVR